MKARHLSLIAAAAATAVTLAACSSSGSSSSTSAGSGSTAAATKEPAGFYSMNTSTCSDPSQVTKKITGTLTLGWSGPFSGPIAPFADAVIQGAKDRFAVQNAAGGIDGVKLAIATKDDQFNPAMTKTNVDGWIQSNSVQAFDVFGSGPLAAVAADQNLACLPELLASATDDTYRDIAKYPWTTEFLPSNNVEEAAEVKVIQAAFPGASKITVAVAEDQTGSGQSYLQGMQNAVKGTNVVIKKVVPFGTDPGAAAISLQQAGANVVFGALVVPECLQLTAAMAKIGYTPKLTVQASNCGSASLMFAPAGAAANGQKLVFWEKDPGNPIYKNDPGYNAYVTDATKVDPAHAQPADTYYETGWMIADMDINAFGVAAKSSLGLSEVGIMQAARNQNYQPPLFINGIRWIMNANEAYGIMKLQPLVYSAATKSFSYDGSVIDTCPSILSAASCTGGL
ncbi:MAG: ABC transporter substrate-binding protein [Streptosporangiaceae bacterium]|jgi:branched-chain amino acid transport system substrate-binding protein